MLFGKPYKVWWWYVIGQPKKEKGLVPWLRNTLGEAPVFLQDLNPELNAQNMETLLDNEGYFNSTVSIDTVNQKRKLRLIYNAMVQPAYKIGAVHWRLDSSRLSKDILLLPIEGSLLKSGDQYNAKTIKAEKERITQLLKGKGYYYIEPDHLLSYIDTNHKSYTAFVYMAMNQPVPDSAKTPYAINHILVRTPFNFQPLPDSIMKIIPEFDGIYIYDSAKKFEPEIFVRAITYRKGSLYSLPEQNRTQIRLNSLGTFRFIKAQYAPVPAGKELMDVTYLIAPFQKRKLETEIGGFTRSNSYSGGQLSIQWGNKNFRRKAESLLIKATGSFELTPNDSLKNNNNWRLGLEASWNIPKLLIPFKTPQRPLPYFPKTSFPLSYDWVRHQDLYTEKYFNLRYELSWSDTSTREYRFSPFNLTITNTANFTNSYYIRESIDSEINVVIPTIVIPSLSFQYIIKSNPINKAHSMFLHTGVELAGNLLGLIKGNNGPFSTKIANAYFMQFVKLATDFRYYHKLGNDLNLASRMIIGASYPYGNSPFLPFSRQYIIGGANSLRGFIPRHLGPGGTLATDIQQSVFPQIGGDYKLELNTELRYSLGGRLKGAVFADAGNIWMKDTVLYGEAGKLTKDFYKQIAVDAGIGLRVDVSIVVIRLDLAVPFYKPWLPEGERWTFESMKPGSKDWRKENLIWNFALGYPF